MTIQLEVNKTYLNRLGEKVTIISKDSDVSYPFNSASTSYTRDGKYFCGSHADDQDLVEEYANDNSSLVDINDLVNDLLNGVTYYTAKGGKVYMKDNKFWFNESRLDLNKIIKVDLFTSAPKVKHPLIGKVCKVYDSQRENCKYGVITEVCINRQYKYILNNGSQWMNAELVIQTA